MNPQLNIEGRTPEQKIEEAVELLLSLGFSIRPPLEGKTEVKTSTGLVKFFYNSLSYYSPSLSIMNTSDNKKDLAIAKKFIATRRTTGISKDRAMFECCQLIEFLFKHENRLGLKTKVTSMSVLGQDKMAWFTSNLINAYNGFNNEIEDHKERIWFENFYDNQELSISEEQIALANKRIGLGDDNGEESS
jgi:hypothetical protein